MEMREQFWTLAVNVTNQVSKTNDHRTVEPLLLEILNLVKANPQDRQFFVEAFITILHDPRKWSNLIVPFCMRELQFQELYQEALRLQNCGDMAEPANTLVLQVYRTIWPLGHSFQYYKEKEPPIPFSGAKVSRWRYLYHRTKGALRRFLDRS
jgi:hypothetical protein